MSYTLKSGDLLSDMRVGLIDRNKEALDLSTVTSVVIYVRATGATTNAINGEECNVADPATNGIIEGPATPLSVVGEYRAYVKLLYGSFARRVPSKKYLKIIVEESFE